MASNIVGFPGVETNILPGEPRHDIARMFRQLADKAEKGEITAVAGVYLAGPEQVGFMKSTVENGYYRVLGAMEDLKFQIIYAETGSNIGVSQSDYDGDDDAG